MMAIATFGTMASGQIANCKNAITLSVDISFCGVTVKVSEIDSSSSDYDQLLISNNLCNGLGIHEVTLTALKFNGNSSTCTTQVNVVDMSAPVPVNKVQLTVELDSNNQYILTPADLDLGSFDNCGNVSLAISESLLDCTTPSPLSVLFTVTDEAGNYNQSICSVTILQNSNRPATLTCKTYTEIEIKRFGFVELTADMILTGGNYACTSFYNFDLSYNGNSIASHNFNYGDVGKTYMATVTDAEFQSTCQGQIKLIKAVCDSSVYVCDTKSRCTPVGDCSSGHTLSDDVEWPCELHLYNAPYSLYLNPDIYAMAQFMGVAVDSIKPRFDISSCAILGENIMENTFIENDSTYKVRRRFSYKNWATPNVPEFKYDHWIWLHLSPNFACDICDTQPWNTPINGCFTGHSSTDAVEWPADITITTTEASPYDLSINPDVHPNNAGPMLNQSCSNLSMTYYDIVDSLSPSFYKINRHWSILNWNNLVEYKFTQVITVNATTSNQRKICITDLNNIPVKDVEIGNGVNLGANNCLNFTYSPGQSNMAPKKMDGEFYQGIDIADAVLLSEYILNNKLFKAYQHFQLNVDKMQSIDMNDVKSLKDLWLRKNVSLPFDGPWNLFSANDYFYRGAYVTELPPASPFESLQFKAVKIGDINNDALMTNSIDVEFKFGLEDLLLYDGERYSIPVVSQVSSKMTGFQFVVEKSPTFTLDSISSGHFQNIDINLVDNQYRIMCMPTEAALMSGGVSLSPTMELFKLHITSKANTVLSSVLELIPNEGLIIAETNKMKPVLNFDEVIPTATSEQYHEDVYAFPNPAVNKLSLIVPPGFSIQQIEVCDINGHSMDITFDERDRSFATQNFVPGFYIVKLSTSNGNVKSIPFVKN